MKKKNKKKNRIFFGLHLQQIKGEAKESTGTTWACKNFHLSQDKSFKEKKKKLVFDGSY